MEVEWDGRKEEANYRKHGVRFEDAAGVFYDEHAMIKDEYRFGEPRFVMIGRDWLGRLLLVVGTWRDSKPRLISARRATSNEKRLYSEDR